MPMAINIFSIAPNRNHLANLEINSNFQSNISIPKTILTNFVPCVVFSGCSTDDVFIPLTAELDMKLEAFRFRMLDRLLDRAVPLPIDVYCIVAEGCNVILQVSKLLQLASIVTVYDERYGDRTEVGKTVDVIL